MNARPLYLGVTRVSTRDQAENGHSLAAQAEQLRAEAARRGVDVEVLPPIEFTGARMSPTLRDALRRLADREAAGLMATEVDRLARSVLSYAKIVSAALDEDWTLVVLNPPLDLSTPEGRLLGHQLAGFAEYALAVLSRSTRRGLGYAKVHGTRTGNPLGTPARYPADVVARVRRLRARGRTPTQIAERLTRDGVPTLRGGRWWPQTVRYVLARAERGAS